MPNLSSRVGARSEAHTSELQSHHDLVCRLLLEKKHGSDIPVIARFVLQSRQIGQSGLRDPQPRFRFFFNDTATTEIYTLSLLDALPIYADQVRARNPGRAAERGGVDFARAWRRSEEHTSELQSHHDLVCRLLLEKK